ncbi:MAG: tRNA (adenosine(37)-N6)-dimethylallyltransferase MiaA [Deltaproteobacteria bacterium]|nr:tRNA (adenosine(37)-N6)-dimethylallyltransferase MiaA [Deltaproteobacteria bacterium]
MPGLPRIVSICGETATGKTKIAVDIARRFGGEVVNADSMQVYRGMDIGTAKPTPEERAAVPFHGLDLADPRDTYSAGKFNEDARKAVEDILARERLPVAAGGTGLYLKVLAYGMIDGPPLDRDFREAMKKMEAENPGFLVRRLRSVDPVKAGEIPPRDSLRLIRALEVYELTGRPLSDYQVEHGFREPVYDILKIGLRRDPDTLERRIYERAERMMDGGLPDEVRTLLDAGVSLEMPAMAAVGYREAAAYLRGERTREETIEDIVQGTRRLAKRQRTWFRADKEIRWYLLPDDESRLFDDVAAYVEAP